MSTLGEQLQKKNPELMKRFEALQEPESPFARQVEVVSDLLSYPWDDSSLFEEGIRLTVQGQFQEAKNTFERVLHQYPDAYPAYHLLGHVCGCLQNYKDETENYRKAIKIHPNYPQVYFNLGEAYWLQGREKKAFEAFKKGAPLAPDFAVADYWLSFTHQRMGVDIEQGGAGDHGERDRERSLAYSCYHLGNAYVEFGLHVPARHAFKKAVQILPNFAEAYYELGAIHIKRLRNPKRAEKYLEKSEQLFIQQNDLQQAILAHQRCHPKDEVPGQAQAAEAWLKEGLRLQGMERYQGAIDAYKMAVVYNSDYLDAYYNMGIAYGSLEDAGVDRIQTAIGALKKAVAIKPDFIHAYIALGASFIKKSEIDDAIAILKKALKIEASNPNVYYYLGVAYRANKNNEEAVEFLRQAAVLKPDSVQVQFFLGLSLVDSKRYPEACEVMIEVTRIKPDFADGHHILGSLYQDNMVEPEKAVAHLKKAEKLYTKMADHPRASQVRQRLSVVENSK